MNYGLLAHFTIVTQGVNLPGSARNFKRVQFWKRGYTGQPIEILNAGKTPMREFLDADSDERFVGLIPKKVEIEVIEVSTALEARQFFVRDERDIRVHIDQVNSSDDLTQIDFRGWVLNSGLETPYARKPYPVKLTAVCGLSLLKKRPLLTVEGKYPEGMVSLRNLLKGGLAMIGYDLPLASICNIRPQQDRKIPGQLQFKDPLSRLEVSAESTIIDGKPVDAWTYLDNVCRSFNASLRQEGGEWMFARDNEISGGWVPANKLGATPTEAYVIRPDVETGQLVGTLRDYTRQVSLTGTNRTSDEPQFSLEPTVDAVAVAQTFGEPISKLVNGAFNNLTSGFLTGWARVGGGADVIYRSGNNSPADPFGLEIKGAGTVARTINAPIVVGAVQTIVFRNSTGQNTLDMLNQPARLTGRFKGTDIRGAKILIQAGLDPAPPQPLSNWVILGPDGQWIFNPSRGQLNALEIQHFTVLNPTAANPGVYTPITKADYGDIDITIPKSPGFFNIVSLEIHLCQATRHLAIDTNGKETANPLPVPATAKIKYENMRLVIGDKQKRITGQTITVRNYSNIDNDAVLEQPTQADPTITLGDLPSAVDVLTTNTLQIQVGGQYVRANQFNKPTVPSIGILLSSGRPLVAQNALERAAQQARPALLLEAGLLGRLPYGSLSILRLMDQAGADGAASFFQIVGYEFDYRLDKYKLVCLEILRDNRPLGIDMTWQTPDGDLPQDADPSFAIDSTGDIINDPLDPKKQGKIGQLTQNEILDKLNSTTIKTPILLNSGGGTGELSDTYPLDGDGKQQAGTVKFYQGTTLLRTSTFTGAEVVQYVPYTDSL